MFGSKKRALQQEVDNLRGSLDAMESSSAYQLGLQMETEVETILDSGGGPIVDQRVEAAIAARRDQEVAARAGEIANERVRQAIEAQKERIQRDAIEDAGMLAREALQAFMQNDAPAYRERVRKEKAAKLGGALVEEAMQQIEAEEHQKLVEEHKPEARTILEQEQQAKTKREALKHRAAEIRKVTKNTNMITMGLLEAGDPLRVYLTDKGKGLEPLNYTDGYSSHYYRSDMERRRLDLIVRDTETGLFEIVHDSWLGESKDALLGGRLLTIDAMDPVNQHCGPVIVRNAPLSFIPQDDGIALPPNNLAVWWAELGEFKILS